MTKQKYEDYLQEMQDIGLYNREEVKGKESLFNEYLLIINELEHESK